VVRTVISSKDSILYFGYRSDHMVKI
jgi:hypothetical protein